MNKQELIDYRNSLKEEHKRFFLPGIYLSEPNVLFADDCSHVIRWSHKTSGFRLFPLLPDAIEETKQMILKEWAK